MTSWSFPASAFRKCLREDSGLLDIEFVDLSANGCEI